MSNKAQPRRAITSCSGSIVLREHAADDIFVDIDAKAPRDLLGDAGTASPGIAALEFKRSRQWVPLMAILGRGVDDPRREEPAIFAFLERLSWNLNKVPGYRITTILGIRLARTNSDPRPKTKRSNEFRFGAHCRALMTNWCFSNKDSVTTARTPPGRISLAMVASGWTASISSESSTSTVARCPHLTRRAQAPPFFEN